MPRKSFRDREVLWNAAETAEIRINSRVGREILAVLPRELSDAENLELVREFVHERLVGRGMCCDCAIHAPTASDGLRQPHVHILCSVRAVGPDGFGAKARQWDKRELVTSLRQEWAAACNRSLEMAGREVRVDHRSLAARLEEALARGDFEAAATLDRLPGVHLGPAAHAMEREGIRTDIGDELRAITEENAARAAAYEAIREVAQDVGPEAQARFLETRAASAVTVVVGASCGPADDDGQEGYLSPRSRCPRERVRGARFPDVRDRDHGKHPLGSASAPGRPRPRRPLARSAR